MSLATLAVIEDDSSIRELLSRKLRAQDYEVLEYPSAEEAIAGKRADLYIVDVMLKGEMNGLEFCEQMRERIPQIPILILSALAEPNQRIDGLRSGADDYITKPFEMEELLLRVNGMLKRRVWYDDLPRHQPTYEWDEYGVDFLRFEAHSGEGVTELSQKECMILKLLIENEGRVVSRDEILDKVWGYQTFPTPRTVDNFILRFRKIFDSRYFQSVRGAGYRFSSKGVA